MRKLLFFLIFFCTTLNVFALDVVYPKKEKVNINSKTTFFVGSADNSTPLIINGDVIPVHSSGGFAYFVHLEHGNNKFIIKSGDETKEYNINSTYKSDSDRKKVTQEVKIYAVPKLYFTTEDKTPVRTTPTTSGINRIVHLQKGIPLYIDGELGKFYRVTLSENEKYWVAKNHVKIDENISNAKSIIISKDYKNTKKHHIYTYNMSGKIPYIVKENSDGDYKGGIGLSFYNTLLRPDTPFEIYFPLQHDLFGYSAEFEDDKFILKIRKQPKISSSNPLKDITITIDAGHGGNEKGAIGCLGNYEKDLNLDVALKLKNELEKMGAKIIMTREKDEKVSLKKRVEITNDNDSDIFISIHGNALPDSQNPLKHRGTSVFYYYPQSKNLAKYILTAVNQEAQTINDGVRQGSFAVVRNTNALSVLVELAYLINPEDNAMLINDDFRNSCAKGIALGVSNYLKSLSK